MRGLRKFGGPWDGVQAAATPEQIGIRDGRCISGDFIAHASYRVTGNAVAMGEAAGATAAVAAKNKSAPHDIPWSEVQRVIEKVRAQG